MTQFFTSFAKARLVFVLCIFSFFGSEVLAQFNPSSGTEFGFPTNVVNGRTEHSSCYKFGNVVLAAWDGPSMGGQVMWQVLNAANSPVCQGIVNYSPGIREIEVGMVSAPGGGYMAFVAYHRAGSGHWVEQWLFDPVGCTFTSMGPAVNLSSSTLHTRISMDSHKLYGLVIAWEEASRLRSIVYLSSGGAITSSIIHTVPTPGIKISEPDVAFSHPNSSLDMNYVYLERGGGGLPVTARVRQASFWTEYASPIVAMTAPLVDVNPLSGLATHRVICNIDAPDHNWNNWSYAYTDDLVDVSVRIFNGGTTTITMTDGSLPGMSTPINSSANTRPTLSYNSTGNNFMVGWHTQYNYPMQSYVAAEVLFDGSGLTSAPDFLEIPLSPSIGSPSPTLAFAKTNENTNNFLYSFFSELNGSGLYDMKHKFHNWSSPGSFKKESHEHCDEEHHLHELELAAHMEVNNTARVYPNPSTDFFSLSSTVPVAGNSDLVVSDLTGKRLMVVSGDWNYVNAQLRTFSQNLEAGTYFIQIASPSNALDQTVKAQKL